MNYAYIIARTKHTTAIIFLLTVLAVAQTFPQITTQQVTFNGTAQPQPVTQATVNIVGAPGPQIYYVWVVANFSIGNATPSPAFMVRNAPSTLTNANYLLVSWFPVSGATTYDVLLTTTDTTPSGACNCAAAAAVSGTTFQIKTNTLSAYTVNTYSGNPNFTISNPSGSLKFRGDNGTPLTLANSGATVTSLTATSPAITPTGIEGIQYADQFCSDPHTLDASCLTNAVVAIGGDSRVLFISSGTYAIEENITIPANITLQFADGAVLDVASGDAITVDGYVSAGRFQITSGAGDFLVEGANKYIFPEWYGALPTGTDIEIAMQHAYTDAEKSARPMSLASGTYAVCGLQLGNPATKAGPGDTSAAPSVSTFGAGSFQSLFTATSGCTDWVVQRNNTSNATFADFGIRGGDTAKGIDLSWVAGAPASNDVVMNISVENFVTYGIDLDGNNGAGVSNVVAAKQNDSTGTVGFEFAASNGVQSLTNIQTFTARAVIGGQDQSCTGCYFGGGLEVENFGPSFALLGSQVQAPPGEAAITFGGGNPSTYGFSATGSDITLASGSSVFGNAPGNTYATVGNFTLLDSDLIIQAGATGTTLYDSSVVAPDGNPIAFTAIGGWEQISLPDSNSTVSVVVVDQMHLPTTASGALTSNAVILGTGGSGVKASGVLTDDGTTLTYGGTGGITTPNGSITAKTFLGTLQNSCAGISAAMVAGTVTISNTCISGSRPVMLVEAAKGGTQGILSYTQSAGSLVITSSSSSDTSTVSWAQN